TPAFRGARPDEAPSWSDAVERAGAETRACVLESPRSRKSRDNNRSYRRRPGSTRASTSSARRRCGLAPLPIAGGRSMLRSRISSLLAFAAAAGLSACDSGTVPDGEIAVTAAQPEALTASRAAAVNAERLAAADEEPGQWMSHGRTYGEQRYSPLDQIDTENVSRLGLAWYADLDTNRGQEATPLMVDGVIYVSTAWSKVKAYDAVTGELLWDYDPKVPGGWGVHGCCDVVNRGVAVWEGKVFVGTFDGRLVALDAASGDVVWEVNTIDRTK